MTRFIRDFVLTSGIQFAQAASAMLAGVIVARYLGPAANGTLSVLVAIGTTAVLLGSLGVHYSGIYFLGRFKSNWDAVLSNVVGWALIGGPLTALATAIVVVTFERQLLGAIPRDLFLLFVAFVPCNFVNQFARRAALGANRIVMYNLPDLIGGPGLLLGTACAILVFGRNLVPLVLLRVLLEATAALLLLIRLLTLIRDRFRPSLPLLHQQVRYGIRNYAGSLLWLLLLQSDLVLCNYFLGRSKTGVYSVAVSLGIPVTMASGVLAALVFQRASREDDRPTRIANTNRVLRVLAPLSAVGGLVLAVAAHWAVPLIYGARFAPAGSALAILVPGLVFLSLEMVLMSFFGGEGSPPIVYCAPVVGLLLNFGANLFVIPLFGINGASATSSVGYAAVFALVLAHYLRSTGSRIADVLRPQAADFSAMRQRGRPARLVDAGPSPAR